MFVRFIFRDILNLSIQKKYPTNISLQLHYLDRNMSTFENYPIYSFKNTLSLLKYFWICINLMTLKKIIIRILSVGFNGNNTINYFTNNGFQVLKQKLATCIAII